MLLALVGYAAVDATTPGGSGVTEPVWVSAVVAVFVAGPALARKDFPLPALAISLAAAAAAVMAGVIPLVATGAPAVAVGVMLHQAASTAPRRWAVPALVASLATMLVMVLFEQFVRATTETWEDSLFGLSFGWLVLVTGWTMGFAARERQRHIAEAAARQAERAVAEERLRIARELHDIVAHSMSVIAVKAGIGNHVAEQRPAEAREALRVIEATSRGSLNEMRHLLGVLRSEVDANGAGRDDGDGLALAPAPGAAGIPTLVDRARSAGVAVTLTLDNMAELPEGIGLSVYRIVQEALTNVVRHAAPGPCTVTVTVDKEDVRIEVVNDGPRTMLAGNGHGLIGMRERVAVYNGTFEAGPRTEGGWRVSAVLPL
jgi:signal transduction histidine kinase